MSCRGQIRTDLDGRILWGPIVVEIFRLLFTQIKLIVMCMTGNESSQPSAPAHKIMPLVDDSPTPNLESSETHPTAACKPTDSQKKINVAHFREQWPCLSKIKGHLLENYIEKARAIEERRNHQHHKAEVTATIHPTRPMTVHLTPDPPGWMAARVGAHGRRFPPPRINRGQHRKMVASR